MRLSLFLPLLSLHSVFLVNCSSKGSSPALNQSQMSKPKFKIKMPHRNDTFNGPPSSQSMHYIPIFENATLENNDDPVDPDSNLFTEESAQAKVFHRAEHHQQQQHLLQKHNNEINQTPQGKGNQVQPKQRGQQQHLNQINQRPHFNKENFAPPNKQHNYQPNHPQHRPSQPMKQRENQVLPNHNQNGGNIQHQNQMNQGFTAKGGRNQFQFNHQHQNQINQGPPGKSGNQSPQNHNRNGNNHSNQQQKNNAPNNEPIKSSKYDEEVLSHNIDSKHYPHQYAIQIRWGRPGQARELAKAPPPVQRPDRGHRTMNDEKSRYRQFAHQEEEHWHDKKWINIGEAPKEEAQSDNEYAVSHSKFNTLPVYVRPLRNEASMSQVHQHFAVPSRSFPVNKKFMMWANSPVNMRTHRQRPAPLRRGPGRGESPQRRGHWRK